MEVTTMLLPQEQANGLNERLMVDDTKGPDH
jgi:hypothetical protein